MRHYCTIPRNNWLKVNIVPARGATVAPPYVTTGLKVYIVAARGATIAPPHITHVAQSLHCCRQRRHCHTTQRNNWGSTFTLFPPEAPLSHCPAGPVSRWPDWAGTEGGWLSLLCQAQPEQRQPGNQQGSGQVYQHSTVIIPLGPECPKRAVYQKPLSV